MALLQTLLGPVVDVAVCADADGGDGMMRVTGNGPLASNPLVDGSTVGVVMSVQ